MTDYVGKESGAFPLLGADVIRGGTDFWGGRLNFWREIFNHDLLFSPASIPCPQILHDISQVRFVNWA